MNDVEIEMLKIKMFVYFKREKEKKLKSVFLYVTQIDEDVSRPFYFPQILFLDLKLRWTTQNRIATTRETKRALTKKKEKKNFGLGREKEEKRPRP